MLISAPRICSFKVPRQRGMALVIVLAMVVLLAAMAVGFFLRGGIEVRSAKSQESATRVSEIGTSAMQLALAQIAEATSGPESAWASQPGMIRTFDAIGGESNYKLYSSDQMVVSGSLNLSSLLAGDLPNDWQSRSAEFVDLNSPAIRKAANGALERRYPIVDPAAADSAADGGSVEGFSVSGTNGVQMPVRWLYLLADGQFSPIGADGKVAGANANNPIVGRFAFWTDDDSCKVNVNTASEGVFWDTPIGYLSDESVMNRHWAAQGEFQRYPGHPAFTSISPVFPNLAPTSNPRPRNTKIYDVAPYVKEGGSREGTQWSGTDPFPYIAERLYDNVDELKYKADRVPYGKLQADDQLPPYFSDAEINRKKFFLTAQSRSPEVNLFNQPRVGIWPLHQNDVRRNSAEKLIALACTVGKDKDDAENQFYFTREDPLHPQKDFLDAARGGRNKSIYQYLQGLTEKNIPGFGGNFLAKFGGDRDQVLTEIFDYIRGTVNLRSRLNPANLRYTGNGTDAPPYNVKFGEQGMVVPTILDGASGLNVPAYSGPGSGTKGFGRILTVRSMSLLIVCDNYEYTLIGTSQTNKRWTMTPVLVVDFFMPSPGFTFPHTNLEVEISGLSGLTWEYKNSAGQIVNQPMWSNPTMTLHAKTWERTAAGGASNEITYLGASFLYSINSKDLNGNNQAGNPGVEGVPGTGDYENPTGTTIVNYDPTFRLSSSANITVKVSVPTAAGKVDVQRLTATFPSIGPALLNPMPIPNKKNITDPYTWTEGYVTFWQRMNKSFQGVLTSWFEPDMMFINPARDGSNIPSSDFIRSMISGSSTKAKGDFRLLAARLDVPQTEFEPHPDWHNASLRNAFSLRLNPSTAAWGSTTGLLVENLGHYNHMGGGVPPNGDYNYGWPHYWANDNRPGVPAGINGVKNHLGKPGDWDNGTGWGPDGPYINKADEGAMIVFNAQDANFAYYQRNSPAGVGTAEYNEYWAPLLQLPSPVMFGSLPVGVKRGRPWQTLLFCPNPAAGWGTAATSYKDSAKHDGFGTPPDHLLLDLFWMPVTEPWAISEPFSTAGKINMNYQILPFNNIKRDTGMRAALRSLKIGAIPEAAINRYKDWQFAITNQQTRHSINEPQTLRQFDERFDQGKIFKSASEICDIFLVPSDQTLETTRGQSTTDFWSNKRLTGDNTRERPYAYLYPRLTTKSNTYTVHVRAETIQQGPGADKTTFNPAKDKVTAECRESYTVERYLDPNNTDYTEGAPLGPYKFRTLNRSRFTP